MKTKMLIFVIKLSHYIKKMVKNYHLLSLKSVWVGPVGPVGPVTTGSPEQQGEHLW